MSRALAIAVENRWNAAGLNTRIAPLYPAGQESDRRTSSIPRAPGGAPEGTPLPRAEYVFLMDKDESKSRASRITCQPVRFQIWVRDSVSARAAADLVQYKFVNSEIAAGAPISLAVGDGAILGVEHDTTGVFKMDDAVFLGIEQIEIRWRKANVAPV